MALFKSIFSRVHIGLIIFAITNILLGLALKFYIPGFRTAALLHLYAGLLIFPAPLLILILMKDRKMAWKAFKGRLLIHKKDFDEKRNLLIVSKLFAWLFLVSLVFAAAAGIIIKSGLAAIVFPDIDLLLLHTRNVYFLPPLLLIHVLTMRLAYRRKHTM